MLLAFGHEIKPILLALECSSHVDDLLHMPLKVRDGVEDGGHELHVKSLNPADLKQRFWIGVGENLVRLLDDVPQISQKLRLGLARPIGKLRRPIARSSTGGRRAVVKARPHESDCVMESKPL